jgi:hypothetical protein
LGLRDWFQTGWAVFPDGQAGALDSQTDPVYV